MRNGNHRAALHQTPQRLLDKMFGLTVEGGGRFVQDQDAGVLQDRPGDGDPLALTAGQLDALLADDRAVAERPAGYELVTFRLARDGGDVLVVGIELAIGDIGADRTVEDAGLL